MTNELLNITVNKHDIADKIYGWMFRVLRILSMQIVAISRLRKFIGKANSKEIIYLGCILWNRSVEIRICTEILANDTITGLMATQNLLHWTEVRRSIQ